MTKDINSLDDEIISFKTIPELRSHLRQEYAARLTKLYKMGSPDQPQQQQLFNAVDKAKLGAEYFYNFINEEAEKRNMSPVTLIEHFSHHQKELISLFKEPKVKAQPKVKIELKVKKPLPKFSKIYASAEIENIMQTVFKTQKLTNKGLQSVDIPVAEDESMTGEVMVWESKGIEYFIKTDDLLKLEGRPPKVYVSQIKNISLLMGMVQEQQYLNITKEAKCEFYLPYLAERRGATKQEIASGSIYEELKRDLMTGAYTTYRIDKIKIEGKIYTAHGIPNFYVLFEPKNRTDKWVVIFNDPYRSWIEKVLNTKGTQYFITDSRAIEDRKTTNKPFLFLFYMQLIKRKRPNLLTSPLKIGSLLADMKIDSQILARPKECYELLKECLIYFSKHYDPPEIEQFFLYNDFNRTKTVKMPLYISEAFSRYSYDDFKGLLLAIGIKDIREAYISFKRPNVKPENKTKHFVLTEADKELIGEILQWAKDWEEYHEEHKIPHTEEERYKFLSDCIRYLGRNLFMTSWINEQSRENENNNRSYHVDDPIGYFTKRLPELLRENKENKENNQS